MINTLMLIDDENLFHLVFEDACSLLDMALSIEALDSSDEADAKFKEWFPDDPGHERPECVFVDLNIIGSSMDGNGCVIGIISSSEDQDEINKAKAVGAQFWIIKSDDIEPRLEEFMKDYNGYVNKTNPFKVYR